ncbi:site-specific DNA-methyltransferase [Euzebya sp.]|uniref:DNA-methyltransferase n=1 Tax=Euzebya sp. TaxID=1971409 RepID=UPI003514CBDE
MTADEYITDDARGDGWHLMLGDSCERLAEIGDDTVDLSVYSPPFASLYTYSPSLRDLGNNPDRDAFLAHYRFVIDHVLRVTKPGRLSVVHVQQLSTTKATHGVIGLTDFRGQVIAAHEDAGWIFHGEVTIDKDPQAQAIRTKAHALMFQTLRRDATGNRPAMADYLLVFRKPGTNAVPVKPTEHGVTNEDWISWARPVWYGIRETNTLNTAVAKDDRDERHICPLQLDLIERCVRLWSNPDELVLSPFAGIGSEGHEALRAGRRFVGCELKPSYWRTAADNLRVAEQERDTPTLMDEVTA